MKKKNVCILVLLAALFAACSDSDIVIDPTELPPFGNPKDSGTLRRNYGTTTTVRWLFTI
jgi:hypothetical protein